MTSIILQASDLTVYARDLGIWSSILEDYNLPADTESIRLVVVEAHAD